MKPAIITICLVLLATTICAYGTDRLVPSQYPTIQAAIDVTAPSDTVIIAPGTYTGPGNWDIDLRGKAITVQSTNPDDPDVVAGTIIDCYNPVSTGYHNGFTFQSFYGSGTIVSGLTIIDGQTSPMDGSGSIMDGGGMRFMNGGSPTIKNCVIAYNNASRGGGISCSYSSPVFINCTISENWAAQNGGGVYCYNSTPKFFDCTIIGNFAISLGSSGYNYGGGIYFEGYSNPTLENAQIMDNLAASDGGGIYSQYGLNIKHCTISGNISERSGGAVFCNSSSNTTTLSNCILTGNSASLYGGAVYAGDTIITNCTFSGNRTYQANNGTIYAGLHVFKITNTIIWEDGNMPNAIQYHGVMPTVMYCDIQGTPNYSIYDGSSGNIGNIAIDPRFAAPGKWTDNNSWVSGDYHLSIDSGCINMGDPNNNAYKNDRDIDSEPRIKFGRVDIGADEADTHPMDFDQDGSVDFRDFARFAGAWLWQAKWAGPDAGMVAYYPFDGNASDASGNGNNGNVVGAVFEPYGAGDTMALHFRGNERVPSYVVVPRSASLEPVDAISISMWVKGVPGQACGYGWGTILRKADDCQPGYFIRGCNGGTSFWLDGANPCSGSNNWTAGFPLFTGTSWQHIVGTYSRSDGLMKSYENGVLVNQTPLASQLLHSGNLYIGGAAVRGDDGGFNGLINEVRIYNRALSVSDIQQLYLSGSGSHP